MAWKMNIFLSLVLQLLNSVDGTAKTYDILILGAGASGIGAALECRDRGIENFLVLEAKDYIGGRMKTGKIGNNITVELGAGWVHHADLDHRMYKLIKKHKLDLYTEDYKSVDYREDNGNHINASATTGEMDAMMDAVDSLAERRAEEGKGTPSLGTALRMVGWRPDTPIKRAVEFWVFDFENGCTPNKIDSIAYGYTGSGDDFVVTDQDGYSSALREEIKPIREKFKLEVEVTKISKGEGRYVVTTSKGTFLAKHVVITFSSGVLLANHVEFSPPLPAWKREPLGMVPMVSYCKYFLLFNETFWSTDFHFTMLVDRKRGYFQHLQDMTMKAPHLLLVTVTDELCREQALVPDDEIIDQVHKSLKESYRNAPRPLELTRYSWDQDRFFEGAYSTQNGGVTEDDYSALEHPIVDDNPKDSSLWFTGEYTVASLSCFQCSATNKQGCQAIQKKETCADGSDQCMIVSYTYKTASIYDIKNKGGYRKECIKTLEQSCTTYQAILSDSFNNVQVHCCQGDNCNSGERQSSKRTSNDASLLKTNFFPKIFILVLFYMLF